MILSCRILIRFLLLLRTLLLLYLVCWPTQPESHSLIPLPSNDNYHTNYVFQKLLRILFDLISISCLKHVNKFISVPLTSKLVPVLICPFYHDQLNLQHILLRRCLSSSISSTAWKEKSEKMICFYTDGKKISNANIFFYFAAITIESLPDACLSS